MTLFYGLTIIILSCLNVLLCFCIFSPLQLNFLFRTQGRPRKLKFSASKRQVEDQGRESAQEGPQCPAQSHQHLLVSCDHRLNSGALALSSPPLQRSTCPSFPRILPVLTPGELKKFVHLFTILVKVGTSSAMTGIPGQRQNCPQQVQLSLLNCWVCTWPAAPT